jgi:Tol biopolymer transport system component
MSRLLTLGGTNGLNAAVAMLALALAAACDNTSTAPPDTPRPVASVVVSPATRTLLTGDEQRYAARVLDANGQDITDRPITWSSSNPTVASISTDGLVTALQPGTVSINASVEGRTGSGALQVELAPVATVSIDPPQTLLLEGQTRQVAAITKDAAGRVLTGRAIAWTAENPDIATVSGNGLVTALAVGTTTIRASSEGRSAEAEIKVTAATVASIEVSVATLALEEGEGRTVTAIARDAAGRELAGRPFTWASEDPTVAAVDGAGRITALRIGTTRVTATTAGVTAAVQLAVRAAAVASVLVQPRTAVLEVGESRQMSVIVRDARGAILDGRAVQWRVDGGTATVTPNGLLIGMRNGYASIIATVDGVSNTATGTITAGEDYAWDLLYHRESPGASELYTYRFGTEQPPVRINAGSVSYAPTGSPDGARIAFAVSMTELNGVRVDDIFAVDRNGLNMRRLTNAPGYDNAPAWSPTAARIAWVHYGLDERADIWVMNADGTNPVNLTGDLTGGVGAPAWSPDGTRLAFVQSTSGAGGTTARIITMAADGTDKRVITSTTTGFDTSPTWSADGTQIAFLRFYQGDNDITIVGAQGGPTTRLALPGNQWSPAWSPDGRYIAYHQSLGPTTNIFTVRPDGTHIRLRTVDPAWGGGVKPTWILRR